MKKLHYFTVTITILFITSIQVFSETEQIFFDDFETSLGWVRNPFYTDDATTGMWERDNPEETVYDVTMQSGTTVSGVKDLCTGHLSGDYPGSYDIDYGKTTVRSPDITLPSDVDITLSFSYYLAHYSNSSSDDYLRVKVVGSTTQLVLEELGAADVDEGVWETFSTSLSGFAGQTIYILIEAADEAGASLVEAGIDDVYILKGRCLLYPPCYAGDFWKWREPDMYAANWDIGGGVCVGGIDLTTGMKFEVNGNSRFNGISRFDDKVGIGNPPNPADIENLQVLGSIRVTGQGLDYYNQIWPGMIKIGDGNNSVTINHEQIEITEGANSFYINPDGMGTKDIVCEGITTNTIKTELISPLTGGEGIAITNNQDKIGVFVSADNGAPDVPAKVGIGTSNPSTQLHVKKEFGGQPTALIEQTNNHPNIAFSDGTKGMRFEFNKDANEIRVQTCNEYGEYVSGPGQVGLVAAFQADGKVGIGTTDPGDYKLAVNGDIKTKKLVVTQEEWSDNVFKNDYDLKPLEDVESYIKQKGHLPGIPSEQEVKQKGVNVGEMQAKLLAQIEEMTLHMIKMSKRIEELESRLDIQK